MKIFNELNEKFIELPEIIQNFMRKLLKKLEITIINPKTGKFQVKTICRIIIQSNFLWKNKKNLQDIRRSKKINKIKQHKLDKKKFFGEK